MSQEIVQKLRDCIEAAGSGSTFAAVPITTIEQLIKMFAHGGVVMIEDKMICSVYANDESGNHMNATIELLAMALFKDACPDKRWCMQAHDQRQRFRKIAQGQLELP